MARRKGFTIVELLVVIFILAFLLSILLPVLARVRQYAGEAVCLSNQGAMITAWKAYSLDNSGNLVGGIRAGYNGQAPYNTSDVKPASDIPWACAPAIEDPSGEGNHLSLISVANQLVDGNGQEYRKFGIELGELWKYTNNHDVYHCPADETILKAPPYDSFVSYSISGAMNGEDVRSIKYSSWNGIKAYTKAGQIKPPAQKMVFVEERPNGQSYLMGSFEINIRNSDSYYMSTWWDNPGIWHEAKSTLSFADGHVEMVEWESPKTLEIAESEYRISFTPTDQYCLDNPDLKRMIRWYGGRK